MPRCPSCKRIATWRLPTNSETLPCRECGTPLKRIPESVLASLLIGACGGSVMGLGLYVGVVLEGRFVLSFSFLLGAIAGYLFIWSQLRLRDVSVGHRFQS